MDPIVPKRLKQGSHLRVIAPSKSGSVLSDDTIARAVKRLEGQGFRVSFGEHWNESDTFLGTATVDARLQDLHDAFADPDVEGILTAIGGYNSNQLIERIDYDLIRNNPKILCGFSDITVLCNSIFARTGVVTYLGPHFSSWAMEQGFEYTLDNFLKSTLYTDDIQLTPSATWSNDEWYVNQTERNFYSNEDREAIINEGNATGTFVGGNIDSFCALMGTSYRPSLEDSILLLEQGDETDLRIFDAQLETILQQPDFSGVKAMMIGRFKQPKLAPLDALKEIIDSKPALKSIPVVANINLGHTTPIATFAIGGKCDIHISTSVEIKMVTR